MNENINLEIQYTVDDYTRGVSFVRKRQFIIKYAYLILPCVPLAILLFDYLQEPQMLFRLSWQLLLVNFAPFLAICLLSVFIGYFSNPILKWNIKRQFKSSPLLRAVQEVSFDETGIKGETALSSAVTKWDAVIEAAETDKDFFFFVSNKKALFVPKRAFADEFQMNLLRGLLRIKLGERAKI
ncbi:MAG TPA: YcxB family protein [Pyrinomonadaceae bacterium]|jgi:hypothetical protein